MSKTGRTRYQRIRARLSEQQGGLCFYCIVPMTNPSANRGRSETLDHLYPRSQTGLHLRSDLSRAVACCRMCNEQRSSLHWKRFLFRANAKLMGVA